MPNSNKPQQPAPTHLVEADPATPGVSRRCLMGGAAAALALGLAGCGIKDQTADGSSQAPEPQDPSEDSASEQPEDTPEHWEFVSRPDLKPVRIEINRFTNDDANDTENLFFLGTKDLPADLQGNLVVDPSGDPVWIDHHQDPTFNVTAQDYQTRPVISWWAGPDPGTGNTHGDVKIIDDSYHPVTTVTTGAEIGPQQADLHESNILNSRTMLVTSYQAVEYDLRPVDGPEDGWIWDAIAQEVDIDSGEVSFEWHSLDHVKVTETRQTLETDLGTQFGESGSKDNPFDYFHINSIEVDTDEESLLISARHTHAFYNIDRASGRLNWTCGGDSSDFEFGAGAEFAWQHDVRRQADGTITLFDNSVGISDEAEDDSSSRGLRIRLDPAAESVTLVAEYLPDEPRLALTQGNLQVLENGNVVIGWGSQSYFSEYTPDARLILDARFAGGTSYRTYRCSWTGAPEEPPRVVAREEESGHKAYISWNGDTETAYWRLTVPSEDGEHVTTVARDGFETSAEIPEPAGPVKADAVDKDGNQIGSAQSQ